MVPMVTYVVVASKGGRAKAIQSIHTSKQAAAKAGAAMLGQGFTVQIRGGK